MQQEKWVLQLCFTTGQVQASVDADKTMTPHLLQATNNDYAIRYHDLRRNEYFRYYRCEALTAEPVLQLWTIVHVDVTCTADHTSKCVEIVPYSKSLTSSCRGHNAPVNSLCMSPKNDMFMSAAQVRMNHES
jgi:hypothetical protein